MNKIEFLKNEKKKIMKENCFSYGLNNVMTCKLFLFLGGGRLRRIF